MNLSMIVDFPADCIPQITNVTNGAGFCNLSTSSQEVGQQSKSSLHSSNLMCIIIILLAYLCKVC